MTTTTSTSAPGIPRTVIGVCALMGLQAMVWGCLALLFGVWFVATVAGRGAAGQGADADGGVAVLAWTGGLALATGAAAALTARLTASVLNGSRRARRIALVVELAMTGLGVAVLVDAVTAGDGAEAGGVLPGVWGLSGLVGAALSLLAVLALILTDLRRGVTTRGLEAFPTTGS